MLYRELAASIAIFTLAALNPAIATVVIDYTGVIGGGVISGTWPPPTIPFSGAISFAPNLNTGVFNFIAPLPVPNFRLGNTLPALPLSEPVPPAMDYTLTVTLPSAPTSAAFGLDSLFWDDNYFLQSDGLYHVQGGADNLPGGFSMIPVAVTGNTISFSFEDAPSYEWLGFETLFRWLGAVNGTFGISPSDVGQDFTVELDAVAVSGVPEPESWVLFIFGFGLIGAALRRQRRSALQT